MQILCPAEASGVDLTPLCIIDLALRHFSRLLEPLDELSGPEVYQNRTDVCAFFGKKPQVRAPAQASNRTQLHLVDTWFLD